MSYMSEMLAEFERGEYRQLKGVALASLECQVAGHQDAFDQSFAEAATPGVIWNLVERHQALLVELEKLKAENEPLRKDADRYRWLRKVAPSTLNKMQVRATTDGGDVLYFHADRFDPLVDAAMAKEHGQ